MLVANFILTVSQVGVVTPVLPVLFLSSVSSFVLEQLATRRLKAEIQTSTFLIRLIFPFYFSIIASVRLTSIKKPMQRPFTLIFAPFAGTVSSLEFFFLTLQFIPP